MAVATVDTGYVCASGEVLSAGRFRMPLWRRGLTPYAWTPVGASTLSQVNPESDPAINADYPGIAVWRKYSSATVSGTQINVITAWNGASYDRDSDVIWLPNQGGHGDYGGNESYRQSLLADVPVWTMPLPPSGSKPYVDAEGIPPGATPLGNSFLLDDGLENLGYYADGRPRSSHTYNKYVFVPGMGPLMTILGGSFRGAQIPSLRPTWLLDTANKVWLSKNSYPDTTSFPAATMCAACYHPATNKVYQLATGTARLWSLDLTTWAWSYTSGGSVKIAGGNEALISIPSLPTHLIEVNLAGLTAWNVATGVMTALTSLDAPFAIKGEYGYDWCDSLGCLVCWPGTAGSTGVVYTITPTGNPAVDPWQWGVLPTTGSPPAAHGNGTFSRFRYSPRLNGLWTVPETVSPTWFLPLG